MAPTDTIAALPLVISIVAVLIAYYSYRGSVRSSMRPVLVFSRTPTSWWKVKNVGAGPAINIVIARIGIDEEIDSATACYPLAAGDEYDLPWIRGGPSLASTYTDVFGGRFTTSCDGNSNTLRSGHRPKLRPTDQQWIHQILAEGRDGSEIQEQDLVGKTPLELDILRNEAFARRGYVFKRRDLNEHFSSQSWYNPVTSNEGLVFAQLSQRERFESHFVLAYQMRTGLSLAPQIAPPESKKAATQATAGPQTGDAPNGRH
jgi:hypothetical protein